MLIKVTVMKMLQRLYTLEEMAAKMNSVGSEVDKATAREL